jgi:hypothetical protein
MKDNNFKTIEQVLLLNRENSEKLKNIAKKDAIFFSELDLMDYSLLVVKISLNKEEVLDLFGKYHRKQEEKEYLKLAELRPNSSVNGNYMVKDDIFSSTNSNNENIIDVNTNEENNKEDKLIYDKIRYKKDKINLLKKYFFPSLKGDILYIISIIDFLQIYNLQKTLETKFKSLKPGVKVNDISCIPPKEYKDRFIELLENITNIKEYLKELNLKNNNFGFEIVSYDDI